MTSNSWIKSIRLVVSNKSCHSLIGRLTLILCGCQMDPSNGAHPLNNYKRIIEIRWVYFILISSNSRKLYDKCKRKRTNSITCYCAKRTKNISLANVWNHYQVVSSRTFWFVIHTKIFWPGIPTWTVFMQKISKSEFVTNYLPCMSSTNDW